jgi:hypothetical protein
MRIGRQQPDFSGRGQRFGSLLTALLILFLGTILLDYTGTFLHADLVVGISILFLAMVLVAAVVEVYGRRGPVVMTFRLLIAATIVTQTVAVLVDSSAMHVAGPVLAVICVGYTIIVVLGHLIRAQEADKGTIYAAISVFLLMGVFWSVVYTVIARLEPGAFAHSAGGAPPVGGGAGSVTSLYFSMVTLTTLGYGDVTPVTTAARMSAALEATFGQVFLVVLVARLVGMSIAQPKREDPR